MGHASNEMRARRYNLSVRRYVRGADDDAVDASSLAEAIAELRASREDAAPPMRHWTIFLPSWTATANERPMDDGRARRRRFRGA